jgi:hypothetical protein
VGDLLEIPLGRDGELRSRRSGRRSGHEEIEQGAVGEMKMTNGLRTRTLLGGRRFRSTTRMHPLDTMGETTWP